MPNAAHALNTFLEAVEGRAFYMARLGTRNEADALDIIQDTMTRFVERYSRKSAGEWKPLFYRVLHSRIADWRRREFVRSRLSLFSESTKADNDDRHADDVHDPPDPSGMNAEDTTALNMFMQKLGSVLPTLPLRQRQAFLMRAWEGLSVAETATAMKCSEGSVKTHYSRALATLKTHLEEHRP